MDDEEWIIRFILRLSGANMYQLTKMVCLPFDAKPLSEPMLTYYQLEPKEYI